MYIFTDADISIPSAHRSRVHVCIHVCTKTYTQLRFITSVHALYIHTMEHELNVLYIVQHTSDIEYCFASDTLQLAWVFSARGHTTYNVKNVCYNNEHKLCSMPSILCTNCIRTKYNSITCSMEYKVTGTIKIAYKHSISTVHKK